MRVVTNGVEHTDEHTLKDILSLWFIKHGMNPVDTDTLHRENMFSNSVTSPFYFVWSNAASAGYLQYEAGSLSESGKHALTPKALEYINDVCN